MCVSVEAMSRHYFTYKDWTVTALLLSVGFAAECKYTKICPIMVRGLRKARESRFSKSLAKDAGKSCW